jgi:hypothetical protein
MHVWYLGCLTYFFASILVFLTTDCMPGTESENRPVLWNELQEAYEARRSTSRLSQLKSSMYNPQGTKFPQLKAKASEVRSLCVPLRDVADRHLEAGVPVQNQMRLALRCVAEMEGVLGEHRACYVWPPEAAELFIQLTYAFLTLQTALGNHFHASGRRLFSVTPKSHYMAHVALNSRHMNPCLSWCFSGEDLVGRLKHMIAASCHGAAPHQVVCKVMEKYCFGLSYKVLGERVWLRT